MHVVGTRALHLAKTTPRQCRYLNGSNRRLPAFRATRGFCFSPARPARPGDPCSPPKGDDPTPENRAAPDGDSPTGDNEGLDTPVTSTPSPSSSPSSSLPAVPATPTAPTAPTVPSGREPPSGPPSVAGEAERPEKPEKPAESLRDAFSSSVGRGRAARSRSTDGLPPVRLPEWFLNENVRHWARKKTLQPTGKPISHDLSEARRLMFPNIASRRTSTTAPASPGKLAAVSSDERERMRQFFEWMLNGAAWDESKVLDAVSGIRRGEVDAVKSRGIAVCAAASYMIAALAYRSPDSSSEAPKPSVLEGTAAETENTDRPEAPGAGVETGSEPAAPAADLSKIDPDNALKIPQVFSQAEYRDHIGSLTSHGLDYCVGPGADEDVARGLPFNYDFGERIGFSELYSTVAAELRAVSPSRAAKDLRRPVSVLAIMNYTGRGKAVSVVDNVAKSLSANVVHLDAAAIAEIVGSYLGQTAYWNRGSISMLGYTAAEKNGRLARRYPARDEDDSDDDMDSSMVVSRLPVAFMRHSALAGRPSSKSFPSDMEDKWEDLKMNNVLEAIIRAADLPTTTASPLTASAASTDLAAPIEPRKVILHVHNFSELSSTIEGTEILSKLRTIVDRLWQRGNKTVLVGSASTHTGAKSSLAERAEELRQEGYHIIPFRVQRSTVPSLAEQMERQDYFSENMGNIRSLMTALTAGSLSTSASDWEWARSPDEADETLQASLCHVVYDVDWVYRLVASVLGSSKHAACDERSFVRALRAIGGEELWWEKQTGAKAPYYYPLGSTKDVSADGESSEAPAEYSEYEKKLLANVIDKQAITTTFDQVVCPAETADSLKALTSLSLVRPEAFLYGVLATERIPGCLLYGPPGTGKTLLAKAVAKQGGANMIEVSAASINDMWLGNSEKNVQALFSLARKMAPVVIFLDEADALLGARQTGPGGRAIHRETITQFLREWDGLKSMNAFIMVATNRPFDLDEAVLRRLPRRILVDLPLKDGRLRILRVMLKDEELDASVSLEHLAAETELYSGSDLKNLCVAAAMEAVREEVRAQEAHTGPEPFVFMERRVLRRAHFDRALQDIGASISEDMSSLQAIRRFDERYGDRRRKKRRHMGFEVTPNELNSEGALVRPATAP